MKYNLPQSQQQNYTNGQMTISEQESMFSGSSGKMPQQNTTSTGRSRSMVLQLNSSIQQTSFEPTLHLNQLSCSAVIISKHREVEIEIRSPWGVNRIKDRIRDLMVYRTLQIDRHIDIKSLLQSVNGTERLQRSFAGLAGALKSKGVISGEIAGTDQNGRPYNRWKLEDTQAIKLMLKRRKIKPLYPEALEVIRERKDKIKEYLRKNRPNDSREN